jgi:hypothetical protein
MYFPGVPSTESLVSAAVVLTTAILNVTISGLGKGHRVIIIFLSRSIIYRYL